MLSTAVAFFVLRYVSCQTVLAAWYEKMQKIMEKKMSH
jgi:hypothetical protein